MLVGLGNLDVVAEDIVEADFQRLNSGAGPLALLDLCDILPAIAADIAQLVEFGVIARANCAAIGEIERRLIGDGGENAIANIRHFVQAAMNLSEPLRDE